MRCCIFSKVRVASSGVFPELWFALLFLKITVANHFAAEINFQIFCWNLCFHGERLMAWGNTASLLIVLALGILLGRGYQPFKVSLFARLSISTFYNGLATPYSPNTPIKCIAAGTTAARRRRDLRDIQTLIPSSTAPIGHDKAKVNCNFFTFMFGLGLDLKRWSNLKVNIVRGCVLNTTPFVTNLVPSITVPPLRML